MATPIETTPRVGDLIRDWRSRRRLSQMALALDAAISTRHLSYIETGRARPSRAMVMTLAEQLDLPLRDRNALLHAAGFAPVYRERAIDDPDLAAARRAIGLILAGHEPFPALAVDRHWTLLAMNRAVGPLIEGVAPRLLEPPVNVLRLSLDPEGLGPRIANLGEWRAHLLDRLARQAAATGDPALSALLDELRALPAPPLDEGFEDPLGGIAVPLRLRMPSGILSFLSTTTVFGTPRDVTLSELALECFFPADAETARALQASRGG
jgi:transcriptional regulator with XRE-family HTH domain